jgi:hypothetical protein
VCVCVVTGVCVHLGGPNPAATWQRILSLGLCWRGGCVCVCVVRVPSCPHVGCVCVCATIAMVSQVKVALNFLVSPKKIC